MSAAFGARVKKALEWPYWSYRDIVLARGMQKLPPKSRTFFAGLIDKDYLNAFLPAVAGLALGYLFAEDFPSKVMWFYGGGAAVQFFQFDIDVDAAELEAWWKKKHPGKKVTLGHKEGPLSTGPYNTANNFDQNIALPRYPFATGSLYSMQNDNGQTWLQTVQKTRPKFYKS